MRILCILSRAGAGMTVMTGLCARMAQARGAGAGAGAGKNVVPSCLYCLYCAGAARVRLSGMAVL